MGNEAGDWWGSGGVVERGMNSATMTRKRREDA